MVPYAYARAVRPTHLSIHHMWETVSRPRLLTSGVRTGIHWRHTMICPAVGGVKEILPRDPAHIQRIPAHSQEFVLHDTRTLEPTAHAGSAASTKIRSTKFRLGLVAKSRRSNQKNGRNRRIRRRHGARLHAHHRPRPARASRRALPTLLRIGECKCGVREV